MMTYGQGAPGSTHTRERGKYENIERGSYENISACVTWPCIADEAALFEVKLRLIHFGSYRPACTPAVFVPGRARDRDP